MGRQIIIQPDGKFAIWSSVVDDFVAIDLTMDQVTETFVEQAAHSASHDTRMVMSQLRNGEKPYHQFTMTYVEACAYRDEVHPWRPAQSED